MSAQLKTQLSQAVSFNTAQSFLSGGLSAQGLRRGLLEGAGRLALSAAVSSQADSGQRHRTPEARKKGIADYSADAYPSGLPLRDEQTRWLTQVRAGKEFQDGQVTVAAVRAAMKARSAGDYAAAEGEIAKASRTQFASAPLVINEAARIRDDMHDTARADALFTRAEQSPDQTVDGYLDHIRMFYRAGQNDRAMALLRQGIARFGNDDKPFISLEVAVSRQAGDKDQALGFFNRCMAYPDPDLKKDCQDAAGDLAGKAKPAPPAKHLPHIPVRRVTAALGHIVLEPWYDCRAGSRYGQTTRSGTSPSQRRQPLRRCGPEAADEDSLSRFRRLGKPGRAPRGPLRCRVRRWQSNRNRPNSCIEVTPAIKTMPFSSRVAVWPARRSVMLPAAAKVPVEGS